MTLGKSPLLWVLLASGAFIHPVAFKGQIINRDERTFSKLNFFTKWRLTNKGFYVAQILGIMSNLRTSLVQTFVQLRDKEKPEALGFLG